MDETEAKEATKFFGLSRNVIFLGAVSFLNDLASDMVFPFIPIFLTSVLGGQAPFGYYLPLFGLYKSFTKGVGRTILADLVKEKLRATAY